MDYTKILLRPVITEKATKLRESTNTVVFLVSPDSNKIEIKRAVEAAFKVTVTKVTVVNRRPAERIKNRRMAHIPGCRKAYVTLGIGDKIEFFEGV